MNMRVALVMPPVSEQTHEVTLDGWPTVVQQAQALHQHGGLEVIVVCRTSLASGVVHREGVEYCFSPSDAELVAAVAQWQPDVVHVHGLGFSRLTLRLGRALHASAAIVLQHHGEPVPRGRTAFAHRVVRRFVDGYLFTGALFGQAKPFVESGMIDEDALCCEVLEAASTLPATNGGESPPIELSGSPTILWVGRLIDSKDPRAAIEAFGIAAAGAMPQAHLHLLATDRTLEPHVRAAIEALGEAGGRVHLHDPAPREAMRAWYQAATIILSTSWREGSGYALVEAITEGCAPVATSIPSHRAIVGDLAPTFSPGDTLAAAALLVAAAQMNAGSARAFAHSHLSWPSVADQLVAAYKSAATHAGH